MSRHLKQNSATKSTSDENHLYDIQMSFKHAFGVSSPLDDKTILLTQTQDESGQISDFTIFPVGKHVVGYFVHDNTTIFFQRKKKNNRYIKIESITAITGNSKYLAVCDKVTSYAFRKQNSVSKLKSKTKSDLSAYTADAPSYSCIDIQSGQVHGQINIYKISNQNVISSFSHFLGENDTIISASFCGAESKLFVTISNIKLFIWSWEKETMIFSSDLVSSGTSRIKLPSRLSSSINFKVTKVRSPVSCTYPIISSSGIGHFRLWSPTNSIGKHKNDLTITTTNMKNWNQNSIIQSQKQEMHYNFIDHVWLSGSSTRAKHKTLNKEQKLSCRLAVLCSQSKVADEKQEKNYNEFCLQVFLVSQEYQRFSIERLQIINLDASKFGGVVSTFVLGEKQGCIVAGGDGHFEFFHNKIEQGEDLLYYAKSLKCKKSSKVINACSCTEDESLIFLDSNSNLLRLVSSVSISNDNIDTNSVDRETTYLQDDGFHTGCILDFSAAVQKPFAVTCGVDKSIRIWNMKKEKCEIAHYFVHEEPISVSIHPSGLLIIVGFKDKLRMYNVLNRKLAPLKELQCKDCNKVLFSDGGQYFAVASGSLIRVYETYETDFISPFRLLRTFSGHIGQVNVLKWCYSDTILYSTGKDGNVYGWDIPNDILINDTNVLGRSRAYIDIVVDLSNEEGSINRIVICNIDGILMEVSWQENQKEMQNLREICPHSTDSEKITAVCLSPDCKVMYAGTNAGNIRIYNWPLDDDALSFQEYPVHEKFVTDINDQNHKRKGIMSIYAKGDEVFSIGKDGSMFVLAVSNRKEEINFNSPYNENVVLVSVEEYLEGLDENLDLLRKIEDLKREHEFSLHSKDVMWKGELKELIESTNEIVSAERKRFQEVQNRHEQTINRHIIELEERDEKHYKEVQTLKNQHDHKVTIEIEKSDELEQDLKKIQNKYDESIRELRESNEKGLFDSEQKLEKTETHLNAVISRLKDEAKQSEQVFKEILDQQEEEYEMELMNLKVETESKLFKEQSETQKMRGVAHSIKSRQEQLNKKNSELKAKTENHEREYLKEKMKYSEIEESSKQMKSLLQNYEDELKEKDAKIQVLKSSQHTLESHRFVLEDKLTETKKKYEPLEKKIHALQSETLSQEKCILKQKMKFNDFQLLSEKKDWKIRVKDKEINITRDKLRTCTRELSQIKRELSALLENKELHSNCKHLEDAVRSVYIRYNKEQRS